MAPSPVSTQSYHTGNTEPVPRSDPVPISPRAGKQREVTEEERVIEIGKKEKGRTYVRIAGDVGLSKSGILVVGA